ncbi:hypothetical protein PS027_23790, partial [Shigella sonnei]|nr:hypothetical protein [Shigella sonnei]
GASRDEGELPVKGISNLNNIAMLFRLEMPLTGNSPSSRLAPMSVPGASRDEGELPGKGISNLNNIAMLFR